MTDWLALAKSHKTELFELIEKLVLIETPTSDKAANDNISVITADILRSLGAEVKIHPQKDFGDHITADWPARNGSNEGHALVVGHLDTVWPHGTLERMGYYEEDGRMYGPAFSI